MSTRNREPESVADHFLWRAAQIHRSLQKKGQLQVRWHEGRLVTFRFPAPNGHGVRGVLVAVYSKAARLEWIEEDLLEFSRSLGETPAPTRD